MKKVINIMHHGAKHLLYDNWSTEQKEAIKEYGEVKNFVIPDSSRAPRSARAVLALAEDIVGSVLSEAREEEMEVTVVIAVQPLLIYPVVKELKKHGITVLKMVNNPEPKREGVPHRDFIGFIPFVEIHERNF